jgi:glyoxylase-like metal-dependent hydrolase (beta-lactamase superfamily II)
VWLRVSALHVRTFTSGAFAQNAYVVWREGGSAVAIDPGAEAEAMADFAADEGLWCEAILLTHAHLDHVEGVAALVRRTGAATYMHPADRPLYERVVEQGFAFGYPVEPQPPVDHALEHGQSLDFGGTRFDVRHTPGHAPGHVLLHAAADRTAFVGDVIFAGSIGRTDLPGASLATLMQSIREQVLTLPDDTVLHTGHGPSTTVGHERASNPFLVPQYGGGFA